MQEPIRDRIYRDIKAETNIDQLSIDRIIQFMFKQVVDTMKEDNLQKIDLQYLGSFSMNNKGKKKKGL